MKEAPWSDVAATGNVLRGSEERRPRPLVPVVEQALGKFAHRAVDAPYVVDQVGSRDSRVNGEGTNGAVRRVEATLQFESEQHVGQLRVLVGVDGFVGTMVEVEIIEMDSSTKVQEGGNRDDSIRDVRQEQIRQRKGPDVIGPDVQFEVIDGAKGRHQHDAGVVDQRIDGANPLGRESAHRLQIGDVESANLRIAAELRRRPHTFLNITHGEDDLGTMLSEHSRAAQADAARRPRDDDGSSAQVGQIIGCPLLCRRHALVAVERKCREGGSCAKKKGSV